MVTINLAYSVPINPSGVSPILSEAQVWNGLKRKVRKANEFVAPILECNVLSEEEVEAGTKVIRQVTFDKEARGKDDTVVEEIVYEFAPTRVDFYQPDGSRIFNLISVDPEDNLILTFAFEWRHSEVEAESQQDKKLREKYFKMAKGAVEGTIASIRKLVKDREL
ncbi:uncharacterized protein FPRO_15384 [Fusarium proliferatum ET1]|uniref:Uncharacterized protein n=1 Tax=Fusarium proliferatum (strain ET1) TaxID=1227346 RepID=A0A1L7VZK9_FUSPR|nr:uncharacterized protein FPRO_15384 [Fusarium proliferatum ET1]KLO97133.1 uncharacterized protein LW93_3106 [Fusarium fujikuroi]CVL09001.1 uncharacterized protein FPRN_14596 [Fusarium proliferatum]CZR45441.1 uncharacterized protein FPRO_15384 [Fusarium proliferatum ET1]